MITYARSRTHVLSARLFPFRHRQANTPSDWPALPFAAGLAPAPARLGPNRCGAIQNGRRASGLERDREAAEWREDGRSRKGAPWQRARTHSESDVSVPKASREKTSEPGRKPAARVSRRAAISTVDADAGLLASTGVHVRTLIYLSPSPSRSPHASIAPVRCHSYSSVPSPGPVPVPPATLSLRRTTPPS